MLRIELLRDLRIVVGDEERPPIRSRKARLVLAFLAVKPGMHSREVVASTFWGDGLPGASRNSLSKELGVIKRVLGEGRLATTRETIGLPSGAGIAVDIREFDNHREREEFGRALSLWRGDFIQDTSHPWANSERLRYRRRAARVHLGGAAEARESGRIQLAGELEAAAIELDSTLADFGLNSMRVERGGDSSGRTEGNAAVITKPRTLQERLAEEVEELEEGKERGPFLFGLSSLDAVTGGLSRGAAMIIAGRPNMGVTTLALTLAVSTAVHEGGSCALFSPEFGELDLAQRLIAMCSGLSGSAIRKGQLSQKHWPRIVRAANKLETAELFFDDSPRIGLGELEEKIGALRQKLDRGLDLVVIDDVHLLSEQSSIGANTLDVAEILFRLCRMAREDGPAIVMTTKVSSAVEERLVKRPLLSDIPGYGDLASRPEQVLLLYREDHYDIEAEPPGRLDVEVAENRHGSTGTVPLKLVVSGPRIVEHDFGSALPDF